MSNAILFSQMFVGGYLDSEDHIAHETINMFTADNKKNYLYIMPSGRVNNPKSIKNVFFVRNYYKRKVVEIIAVAFGVVPFESKGDDDKAQRLKDIKYGKVSLSDIFSIGDTEELITFELKEDDAGNVDPNSSGVVYPENRVLISLLEEEDFKKEVRAPENAEIIWISSEQKTLINQSGRTYIRGLENKSKEKDAYDVLLNKVDEIKKDAKNWKRIEKPFEESMDVSRRLSFLEIIKKS